ncbi:MAG: sulfite exporter TauE/SafE family protein [Armatimonadetes bacterium]|nr:sulfite exporter TauE/SafE family protein [Armatimonadota bacterium]
MSVALAVGVFFVALAYSLVGHGGASGYLALLAFTSVDQKTASTTALGLNLVVAGVTFFTFRRAKHFSWPLVWPFLVGSVPFAFLGGSLKMESRVQSWILAATLTYAAVALVLPVKAGTEETRPPHRGIAIATGAGIGLLSGIVGVGGGIFLSPVMILAKWAKPHVVASASAVFIFANSFAGLLARPPRHLADAAAYWPLILAGLVGAVAGSYVGAFKTSGPVMRRALGAVLLVAVWKLVVK